MRNEFEKVIFSLERDGRTVYRVIANSVTNAITEQSIFPDGKVVQSIFDRDQVVAMAQSILVWDEEHPKS